MARSMFGWSKRMAEFVNHPLGISFQLCLNERALSTLTVVDPLQCTYYSNILYLFLTPQYFLHKRITRDINLCRDTVWNVWVGLAQVGSSYTSQLIAFDQESQRCEMRETTNTCANAGSSCVAFQFSWVWLFFKEYQKKFMEKCE